MQHTPVGTAPPNVTAGRWAGQARRAVASTPTVVRAWQVGAVAVAVLFGLLGSIGIGWRQQAIEDTRAASSQLIRVQDIRVSVVRADAIASSAYLAGGQEDPAQRSAYLEAVAHASDLLVGVAAGTTGDDAARLAEANRLLGVYVGLVEQARANNRQGFPVGAAYQRQANAVVASDAADTVDIVDELRAVEASRRGAVNDSLAAAHRAGAWLVVSALVLLAVLVLAGLWLAQRFRRLLNLPLVAAAVVTLVILFAAGAGQAIAVGKADDAVDGPLRTADLAAQARAAGFDARAQEAFSLINRGNGAANDARWEQAAATVGLAVDECGQPCSGAGGDFADYSVAHREMRDVDAGGDWDEAVRITLDPDGSLVQAFDAFALDAASVVDINSAAADSALDEATDRLGLWRAVMIVGGLLVAGLAAWGLGQRLKEYR